MRVCERDYDRLSSDRSAAWAVRALEAKVSINTASVRDPDLIAEGAKRFGSQCMVVAIDAKRRAGSWEAYIEGGRIATGLDAVVWAREVEGRGAGEILLTSMDRDGTQDGYDVELTRAVAEAISIPVIASGGAGDRCQGAVLASDGFFPFADGVEEACRAGVRAIIQPGGSIRDEESIAAADTYGAAMAFTG